VKCGRTSDVLVGSHLPKHPISIQNPAFNRKIEGLVWGDIVEKLGKQNLLEIFFLILARLRSIASVLC
jgi:hypothetical protein